MCSCTISGLGLSTKPNICFSIFFNYLCLKAQELYEFYNRALVPRAVKLCLKSKDTSALHASKLGLLSIHVVNSITIISTLKG